jgi:hypothetical protein
LNWMMTKSNDCLRYRLLIEKPLLSGFFIM